MTRKSIEIEGFKHQNPIPAASILRGVLASSLITGMSAEEGADNSLDGQCQRMFQRIGEVLANAGGSPDDLLKLTVYLKDTSDRSALNIEWLKMFPDPEKRPARASQPMGMAGVALISCELLAVIA